MTRSEQALVQAESNVQNQDILSITIPMINRMKVEEKSEQTIKSYVRAVEKTVQFHGTRNSWSICWLYPCGDRRFKEISII